MLAVVAEFSTVAVLEREIPEGESPNSMGAPVISSGVVVCMMIWPLAVRGIKQASKGFARGGIIDRP